MNLFRIFNRHLAVLDVHVGEAAHEKPQDFGDVSPKQQFYRVELKRGAMTIQIKGNVVDGVPRLYEKAYIEKDVTEFAPIKVPGNTHGDLIPTWLSCAEIEEAKRLIAEAVYYWETHTYESWAQYHKSHGIVSIGSTASGMDALAGRITYTHVRCVCGEYFHGSPDQKWEGYIWKNNDGKGGDRL